MSQTVDERIVEMRFDNNQFENGAKETLSTLEKLKKVLSLSDSKKSVDDVGKAVKGIDLNGISSGVSALEKRFSAWGIVGMRVIERMTDSMINMVHKGINFVNQGIVQGGINRATNIENAHFQLQTLLKDESKVQKIMDQAMNSVDGTAYAFDEAAKAASMFAASGVEAGDDMARALKAITGVTATTNADYQSIATIFSQVAGQGRVMGDQLNQLSQRGMNAAATLATYFQEVRGKTKVTEADIRKMVSKGQIDFKTFADAMNYAFGDSAKKANETFNGALSNVKASLSRIGAEFISPLITQKGPLVKTLNRFRKKINDLKSVFVFNKEIGNVNALNMQFVKAIKKILKFTRHFVKDLDLERFKVALYAVFEGTKNIFKGLYSVLKPVAQAFREVFLSFAVDKVVSLTLAFQRLTKRLTISNKSSNNLYRTFKGVFDIISLLVDGFTWLLSKIFKIQRPIVSFSGSLLDITASLGDQLSIFAQWVRNCDKVKVAANVLSKVIETLSKFFSTLIKAGEELVMTYFPKIKSVFESIFGSSIIQGGVEFIKNAFLNLVEVIKDLGEKSAPHLETLKEKIIEFKDEAAKMVTEKTSAIFGDLNSNIQKFSEQIKNIKIDSPTKALGEFANKVKGLLKSFTGKKNITKTLKDFSDENLEISKKGFGFDFTKAFEGVKTFKDVFMKFVDWASKAIGAFFSDASFGGVVAGASGIGFILSLTKMADALTVMSKAIKDVAKSIGEIPKSIEKIPKMFDGVNAALLEYQKKLKAERLITIAKAVAILAISIGVLSLLDSEKVMNSAIALGAVAGVLSYAIYKLMDVANAGKAVANPLNTFADKVGDALKNVASTFKWQAVAKSFKELSNAIIKIAIAIIALGLMYLKNPDAIKAGGRIVGAIASILVGIVGLFTLINAIGGSAEIKATGSIVGLAIALELVVHSLVKLFKTDLPSDWKAKLGIVIGILGTLTLISILLSGAGALFGGSGGSTKGLLGMAAALYLVVIALEKIFKMELPKDWGLKLGILTTIMGLLGLLALTIGAAARMAGGQIKAAGTILALALTIVVIVGALAILSAINGEKLLTAAGALGLVLVALGGALYGAGKISDPNAWKSVLAMAVMVAAITVALGVLSMIKGPALAKAAAALGVVLLVLAADLYAAGQISGKAPVAAIIAMIVAVIAITASLVVLAQQPFENILAAAAALSLVLIALSAAFAIIAVMKPNMMSIAALLLASLALIPIVLAVKELAKINPLTLLTVVIVLGTLLAELIIALGVCALIGTVAPAAIAGIGVLDLFIADLTAVLLALGALNKIPGFADLIKGGTGVLGQLGFALGYFVGSIVDGIATGAAVALIKIGIGLTAFAHAAGGFFKQIGEYGTPEALSAVKSLAEMILVITAADIISGISAFLGGGTGTLTKFGDELVDFGPKLADFADSVKDINPESTKAAAEAANMLSEVVKNLPTEGGLKESIFGKNNTLENFGSQLPDFGKALSDYSNSVKDLDVESVQKSKAAADIMVDLAEKLPKTGGLKGSILGDADLGTFGDNLLVFGTSLKLYTIAVKGISEDSVSSSKAAADIMVSLADDIPTTGGFLSKLFGDNSLGSFGANLESFGNSFATYVGTVSGLDFDSASQAVLQFRQLIAIAKALEDVDFTSMAGFINGMNTAADKGISEFIVEFHNSYDRVNNSINGFLDNVKNTLSSQDDTFKSVGSTSVLKWISGLSVGNGLAMDAGKGLVSSYIVGIKTKSLDLTQLSGKSAQSFIKGITRYYAGATQTGSNLVLKVIQGIRAKFPDITTVGTNSTKVYIRAVRAQQPDAMQAGVYIVLQVIRGLKSKNSELNSAGIAVVTTYIKGIKSQYGNLKSCGDAMADKVVSGIESKSNKNAFYNAGVNSAKGFIKGIESKMKAAEEAGKKLGNKSSTATKNAVKVKSPSRVFYDIGNYVGQGYVLGIMSTISQAYETAKNLGYETVEGAKFGTRNFTQILTDNLEVDPTITPMVDTSNVQRSARDITRMLNNSINKLSVEAQGIATIRSNEESTSENHNPKGSINGTGNYTFIQNNTSPKALSRAEIYRQTKNQFAQFREAVTGV